MNARAPARSLSEEQVEGLTVAMVVAPGVYVRNRMFDLFASAGARRARIRSGVVRGILRQLGRATAVSLAAGADSASVVLHYAIPAVHIRRAVELSVAELAALRVVAQRAGITSLPAESTDSAIVAKALGYLLEGDVSIDVRELTRELVAPAGE